jgi:hypothetical protein
MKKNGLVEIVAYMGRVGGEVHTGFGGETCSEVKRPVERNKED